LRHALLRHNAFDIKPALAWVLGVTACLNTRVSQIIVMQCRHLLHRQLPEFHAQCRDVMTLISTPNPLAEPFPATPDNVIARWGDMFLWYAAIFAHHAATTVVVTSKGGCQQ
jgi:hypothetical protein